MTNKLIQEYKKIKIYRDLIIIFIISSLFYVLMLTFDIYNAFEDWCYAQNIGDAQIEQVFLILVFSFAFFLIRRRKELKNEITERKLAEEKLQISESRYRAIVEDQTELFCRFLPDGKLTFVNEAYCRYFGKKREELIGRSFMPLIPDEDHEKCKQHLAFLNRENPVAIIEHRVVMPDGEIRWQQWTDRAIFDEHGNHVESQSLGSDITKRKQVEEKLKKAYEELEIRVQERTAELAKANEALHVEVAEREMAEESLQQVNKKLALWVDELERRNREMNLFSEMSELLQTCLTFEEAFTVVDQFIQELFPNEQGALYMLDDSEDLVEIAVAWGENPPGKSVFTPNDCWALRRGQLHLVEDSRFGLRCRHLMDPLLTATCVYP